MYGPQRQSSKNRRCGSVEYKKGKNDGWQEGAKQIIKSRRGAKTEK